MTISPRLGLSDTETGCGARSRGKTGSGLAGVIEHEGCDRQSKADGVDDVERKDGGTVTGDARIEGKAHDAARKQPAIDRAHDDERSLPGKQTQERCRADDG